MTQAPLETLLSDSHGLTFVATTLVVSSILGFVLLSLGNVAPLPAASFLGALGSGYWSS